MTDPSLDDPRPADDNSTAANHDNANYQDSSSTTNPEFLAPDHPLLQRLQATLKSELLKSDLEVNEQLREHQHTVDKVRQQREVLGVDLYNYQQRLVQQQQLLESIYGHYQQLQQQRTSSEQNLKSQSQQYATHKSKVSELEKKRSALQQEVDSLQLTLQHIRTFNSDIKDEITTIRAVTYGTEREIENTEKLKSVQDQQILQYERKIRDLEQLIGIHTLSIEQQQQEQQRAVRIINETQTEINRLSDEHKYYYKLWQGTLIEINKRNTTLVKMETQLQQQHSTLLNMEYEVRGIQHQLQEEEGSREKLLQVLGKLQSEIQYVEQQQMLLKEQQRELSERLQFLDSSVQQQEQVYNTLEFENRQLQQQVTAAGKAYEKSMQQKQKYDYELLEHQNTKLSYIQGNKNIHIQLAQNKRKLLEAQYQLNEQHNQYQRLQVDILNSTMQYRESQLRLSEHEEEYTVKNGAITELEERIRTAFSNVEKKQMKIQNLHRALEQRKEKMNNSVGDEELLGPLEQQIYTLQRDIKQMKEQITVLQRQWLQLQSTLVETVGQINEHTTRNQQLHAQLLIRQQQSIRLNGECQHLQQQIKVMQNELSNLYYDLNKLNQLCSENDTLEGEVIAKNYQLEVTHQQKLQASEAQSSIHEQMISALQAEKQLLFDELVECEKHQLLWEKKIEVEKETQLALDPEYGQAELVQMRKEIQRMKLRLQALHKHQESYITEMEQTIGKRTHISLAAQSQSKGSTAHTTAAAVNKKIDELKQSIQKHTREGRQLMQSVEESNRVIEDYQQQIHGHQSLLNQLEDASYQLELQQHAQAIKRQVTLDDTILMQKKARKYDTLVKAAANGHTSSKPVSGASTPTAATRSARSSSHSVEQLSSDLSQMDEKMANLRNVIDLLSEEFPRHRPYLQQIAQHV